MKNFEYFEPQSIEEACELLAKYENAKVLAGGVSLMVLLKNKLIFPDQIVNLKTIPGLDQIKEGSEGRLSIGALCRHKQIESSPFIRDRFEVLAEAASKIASPPIRNMGTIGGNICHSDPRADFPPALIALNASLRIVGSNRSRVIPIGEFFTDYYENVLEPDEILVEIIVPSLPAVSGGAYFKLSKVTNSTTIVSVAAVISLDENKLCSYAGLGIAGVAPVPMVVTEVANLIGKPIDTSLIEMVASIAAEQSQPISDSHASAEYRREMVKVLVKRALFKAFERALEKIRQG